MNTPTPAVRRLGRRLLIVELEQGTAGADGHLDVTDVAAAAERAAERLQEPLSRLVGVAGYQALQARALNLAEREWPMLKGVRPTVTPAHGLDGLREALQGAGTDQAGDALAAVLAHLVWLLVTFIGDDLALRTVRKAWPRVELGQDALPAARDSDTERSDNRLPDTPRSDWDRRHERRISGEVGPGGVEATT